MQKKVLLIMSNEHKKINLLFNDLKRIININQSQSKKILDSLKWQLEKHFFIEEKVVFSIFSYGGDYTETIKLINQHKDILWQISKIEKEQENNIKSDLKILEILINNHLEKEIKEFYPKLDKYLNEEDKMLIIDRVEELIE